MTGIDPEGFDLRCDGETGRYEFGTRVLTPSAARTALVQLAAQRPSNAHALREL
jgi:putative heme iron utilization protein